MFGGPFPRPGTAGIIFLTVKVANITLPKAELSTVQIFVAGFSLNTI